MPLYTKAFFLSIPDYKGQCPITCIDSFYTIDLDDTLGIMEISLLDDEEAMAEVSLLRCEGYSPGELKERIIEGLKGCRFPLKSFQSARVVLKPNLLSAADPESGVVTHPGFFRAAAEIVLDYGGRPVLAESPAVASLHNALRATTYDAIVRHLGIEVADPSKVHRISYPEAKRFKSFEIAQAFFEADIIVNLPKFKTHGLTYVTASVKNLFGAVPGMRKSQMHMKLPERGEFCEAILDLYGAFLRGFHPEKPLVHIMDAVAALEGDGPGTGGRPRKMNAVIVGIDGLAVDWVATSVSGLDPRLSPILTLGFRRGLGVSSEKEITVIGREIKDMLIRGFVPASGPGMTGLLRVPLIKSLLNKLFIGRPVPIEDRCSLCYQCMKICPVQAIDKALPGQNRPYIDYDRCIRCFCCMEACPEDGISARKGMLQRLMR